MLSKGVTTDHFREKRKSILSSGWAVFCFHHHQSFTTLIITMMNVIHVLYHGYVNRAEHILLKLELHQVIDVIVLTIADVGNINQNVLIRKISK